MEEEEDRISSLPDGLLIEIMSRMKIQDKYDERMMTTKEVIRTTATISKRWQHLWIQLPNLVFIDEEDNNWDNWDLTDYLLFIDKTLTQGCAKLKEFRLCISFDSRDKPLFKSQAISWIRHAIQHREVQKVNLRLFDIVGNPEGFNFEDELFFVNKCFMVMTLRDCLLSPPKGVIRWENLKSLHLLHVRLDEDMIRIIFSGTPCLKRLELERCHGYRRIDIISESLTMFWFNNYDNDLFVEYHMLYGEDKYIDGIEINAPHLSALTIQGGMCLKHLLLVNVSSLVEVELDYWNEGDLSELEEEMMLKGLLESLSHVNEISFGDSCLEVLSRLQSKGFNFFDEGTDDDTSADSSPVIVAENAKGFDQLVNEVIKTTTEDCDRNKSYLTSEVCQSSTHTVLENEHRLLNEKVITDEQNVKETNVLLLQRILELEKEVASKNEKITRLEDENTKLNTKLDDCKCEMTQMAVMNRLKEDVWNMDVGKLKMQLVTKEKSFKDLIKRLNVLKSEIESISAQANTLQQENHSM